MSNPRDKLNLLPPILFLGAVFVVGTTISAVLQQLNQQRGQAIVERYTQETLVYIEANQVGLETLFTQVFPDKLCEDKPELISCNAVSQEEIMNIISDDLHDFSSTAFIKDSTHSGILVMSLSGEVSRLFPPEEEATRQLNRLLDKEVEALPWDHYTRRFGWDTKEVVVPVKTSQGQTIGAITRGVIE